MKKIGFTIGKFAPFHKGHEYLIETALKEMEQFYIVIYDTDIIDIPIETRAKWIKDRYKNVKLIYAYNSPRKYGLDDESVKIQMEYLIKQIDGIPVTCFYSSEPYGEKVAQYLGIENRIVDMEKVQIPISASKIRANIEEYKKFLEKDVYNDMVIASNIKNSKKK